MMPPAGRWISSTVPERLLNSASFSPGRGLIFYIYYNIRHRYPQNKDRDKLFIEAKQLSKKIFFSRSNVLIPP